MTRTEDGVAETRYFDQWLITPASCQPRTEACNVSGSTLKQAGEWERQGMSLHINDHMYILTDESVNKLLDKSPTAYQCH